MTTTDAPTTSTSTSSGVEAGRTDEQSPPDEVGAENEAFLEELQDSNGAEQAKRETTDGNDGGQVVAVEDKEEEEEDNDDEPTGASGQQLRGSLLVAKTRQAPTSAPTTPPNSSKSENHKSRWSNTDKTNNNKKPVKVSSGLLKSKLKEATTSTTNTDADGQKLKQLVASYYKRPFVMGGSGKFRN